MAKFKEITRFGSGPAMDLYHAIVRESLKAQAEGWTQVGIAPDGHELVLCGIPPESLTTAVEEV